MTPQPPSGLSDHWVAHTKAQRDALIAWQIELGNRPREWYLSERGKKFWLVGCNSRVKALYYPGAKIIQEKR